MSRDEHMAWAKQRAFAELEGGSAVNAVASMVSDLGKHPETTGLTLVALMTSLGSSTTEDVKRWIEGFH